MRAFLTWLQTKDMLDLRTSLAFRATVRSEHLYSFSLRHHFSEGGA